MKFKNKNVTILISALIFVSLANKSHQDYWWQKSNNQVARQAYGNMPQPPQPPQPPQQPQQPQSQTQEPQFVPTAQEQTINGIQFDCTNKPTGPNKDNKYCDVYHACVFGKQLKTYACAQLGERIYYDENTQKCEFSSKNPQSCPSGNYYTPLQMTQPSQFGSSSSSSIGGYQQPQQQAQGQQEQQVEKVEAWKEYVRKNEQFECKDKTDGFYSSKWCNVYYRCFNKIKSEFLCAKMQSGERLWWMKHSEQMSSVQQQEAQCRWPCDIGRKCTSPGGILVVVNDNQISESTSDAQKILDSCPKPTSNNNNNNQQSPSYSNGQMNDQKIVEDNSNDLFRLTDFSDNVCSGASDGSFVSNGKYCNVYHVCIKGVRKDFLCAKGSSTYDLWWNDSTKQCEWPCKLQCTKQIFGSSGQTASDISNLDRKLNPALCGGGDDSSSSLSNNNNNNGLGSYGNQQSDLTRPQPQTTQPSFNNNNNNNNYGSGYGNSYGNYYF